ncbi:hypothetical protein CTI12_AA569020 [Artemisia annua]|uniref:Helitron helicase-like domain-containing protein n=1 Tax=Artemisia annua TaxID=35608 RepID=A0A2U1KSP5_ARTAN|nr:hypothetical protein CTI12_AA569020 [Artemisia annua]
MENTKQKEQDKVTDMKEFVKDDKVDVPIFKVNSINSDLKLSDTKKREISDDVDGEVLNVEDLKTKAKKTKKDVDILDSMREKEWWDKWEWENCESREYEYEDDDCYCQVCQGTLVKKHTYQQTVFSLTSSLCTNLTIMHPGKRKDYDSNNTAGRKDNKVLKNSTGDVSQADLDKQKERVENKREYNKQHYARQKAIRLKQIACGEGSSQHAAAATNVTPRVTFVAPLGILEDRRVNCSSSPMNDSEVIDMTVGDSNTLTTPGDSVLANKENMPPCQNALLHSLDSRKPPETSQKTCRDIKTKNRNYYQRSKEKKGELMRNYQSGQTSTNMTNGIHLPGRTNRAGATNIPSRLTFESNNGIYHRIDQLVPRDGQPRYLQLYFYDPETELSHRLIWTNLDRQIVEILTRVLAINPYVATFRSLADLGALDDYRVTLNASVEHDQRNYNLPTTSEVEGNNNITAYKRSIVVYGRADYPTQIQPHWASYDPLSYVLFFPNGDPGWHSKIPRVGVSMDEIIGDEENNEEDSEDSIISVINVWMRFRHSDKITLGLNMN